MANYTMYYRDFVTKYNEPEALSLIPEVTLNGRTFNFAEMFYNRNKHREICAETGEYFMDLANRVLTEAALIFSKKIEDWNEHLDEVWQREDEADEKVTDNVYYNPTVTANNTEGKAPKLQSSSESVFKRHLVYNTQSNAELIQAALDVQNIFYEALVYTDKLFMSIY